MISSQKKEGNLKESRASGSKTCEYARETDSSKMHEGRGYIAA